VTAGQASSIWASAIAPIQRRNQKLVEETPSPLIDGKFKDLRKKWARPPSALPKSPITPMPAPSNSWSMTGHFYFLEVNKRIQVEHPITEEVTGIDLVKLQISIAMGEPLRLSQSDIHVRATPSNAASTPRILSTISVPAPAGSKCITRPADAARGWTAMSMPATPSRPITTR
jgi:biotin carboxylase